MAFDVGIYNDLSDANSIADPEVMAAAAAVQLPFNIGRVWEDMKIKTDPSSNRKFDIYSRSDTPRNGTVRATGWDNSATTGLPVTSAAGLIIGLILKVESEVVVISGVDTGANTIDVKKRGAAGTTAATHAAAVPYTVIGSAIDDEDLKNVGSVNEQTLKYQNYFQTVAEPIDYTKGGEIDPRKGLSQAQLVIAQEEAMIRVARNVYASSINGVKAEKSGAEIWMTAGILQQLSDTTGGRIVQTYNAAGAFIEAKLKAALRQATDRGIPTDIYCSSANKDIINGFLASSAATKISVNTELVNNTAGYHVNSYDYEGLILNIKIDSGLPNDQIAILNMNKAFKSWKRGDELVLEQQPDKSSREKRAAYNGSFAVALEDVGYEHMLITGIV